MIRNMKIGWLMLLFIVTPALWAQNPPSPYAGQEVREIKALSAQEQQQYLTGEGMGLAKAAELNHYPGPKHALDLADVLELTEEQKMMTKKIYDRMHADAVRLGRIIVDKETALDRLYANQAANESRVRALTSEIGRRQGELRRAHLKAHLEMKRLLSPEQCAKYDALAGTAPPEKIPRRHRRCISIIIKSLWI